MLLSGLLGIVLAAGTVLVGASHPRRAGRGHLSAKELTSLELLHNTMVKNIDLTLEVKRNSFLINGRDAQNADDYDQAVEEHLKGKNGLEEAEEHAQFMDPSVQKGRSETIRRL